MDQAFIDLLLGEDIDATLQLPSPNLVQYYHDLKNRILWMNEEITDESLDFVAKIIRWNREDKDIPIKDRKPIRLFIFSPGGNMDIEETIVSIIKLSKTPIYGIALGPVASAASLIYLSCHRRYALPNAYFVFHRGSIQNVGGNFNEITAMLDDYKEQVAKMEKFYIENTEYPEEIVHEKIKSDWYIHCDEALKYRVVTDLIEDISVLL